MAPVDISLPDEEEDEETEDSEVELEAGLGFKGNPRRIRLDISLRAR